MYNRDVDFNYVTEENNVKVISCTSFKPGNSPDNIIKTTTKSYWLSQKNVPQYITLDLTEIIKRPKHGFRFIGFYSRHAHLANPREIQLVCSEDNKIYERFGGYEIANQPGLQLYEIENWELLQVRKNHSKGYRYNYITIVITKNYGGERTYLNQFFLFESLINYPTKIISDLSTPEELIQKAREFDDSLNFVFQHSQTSSIKEEDELEVIDNESMDMNNKQKENSQDKLYPVTRNHKDKNKIIKNCLSVNQSKENHKLNDQLKNIEQYLHEINNNHQSDYFKKDLPIDHKEMKNIEDIYENNQVYCNQEINYINNQNQKEEMRNQEINDNNERNHDGIFCSKENDNPYVSSIYTFTKKENNKHDSIQEAYDDININNYSNKEVSNKGLEKDNIILKQTQMNHITSKINTIEIEICNLKTSIKKINETLKFSIGERKEEDDNQIYLSKSNQLHSSHKNIKTNIDKQLQKYTVTIEKNIYHNYFKPTIKDLEVKISASLDQMKKTINDFNRESKKHSVHSSVSSKSSYNSLLLSEAKFDKMHLISEKIYSKLLEKEDKLSKDSAFFKTIQIKNNFMN